MKDEIYVIADSYEQCRHYICNQSPRIRFQPMVNPGPDQIYGITNSDFVIISRGASPGMIQELEYCRNRILAHHKYTEDVYYHPKSRTPGPTAVKSDKNVILLLCG